ncbi:hypothetical protein [Nocardia wallacei]|nr:hypothetical protein [Nocardia wallacei]
MGDTEVGLRELKKERTRRARGRAAHARVEEKGDDKNTPPPKDPPAPG